MTDLDSASLDELMEAVIARTDAVICMTMRTGLPPHGHAEYDTWTAGNMAACLGLLEMLRTKMSVLLLPLPGMTMDGTNETDV